MSQLRLFLQGWVDLSEREWQQLAAIFQPRTVEAQAHLLLPGSKVHEVLFVCTGLLRFYYLSEDGTESNKTFIAENAFAGPLAAAALDLPVTYGIQALEPTTLLAAPFDAFTALFDVHPVFDRLGRKLAESLLMHKEVRTRSLLQHNATERYQQFLCHHADLAARIPQYHIASYLGITEVSLSRIRGTLAREAVLNN